MTTQDEKATGYDVIVVGAGVAGGSLINCLARDGRRVLCIERQLYYPKTDQLTEPSRIVGELLQPGGYQRLCSLGLSDALEGIDAQPIYGYGLFLDEQSMKVSYADNNLTIPSKSVEVNPSELRVGRSFHNGRFLKRLREIALEHPNITLIEGNVISLLYDSQGKVVGVTYRDSQLVTQQARASLTIACDGCSSNLRKKASADYKVDVYSKFYGLVLQTKNLPFPNHGHVIMADPAPVLFYPISSTEVRCLVDISSTFQGDVTEYMLNTIAPQVPVEFRDSFTESVKSGAIKMMPNRVMPAAIDNVPGAILLGDAFNMRHPLTGGGMTVALSDISILRALLRDINDLSDADIVARKLNQFYEERKPLSSTINILANALYTLFCARDSPALVEMRKACFDYLSSGGRMSSDPVGMLGGLKPQRFLLVAHFTAVALYGCGRALLPFPTKSRVSRAWSIFRESFNIIKPLIDAENLYPISWVPIASL